MYYGAPYVNDICLDMKANSDFQMLDVHTSLVISKEDKKFGDFEG